MARNGDIEDGRRRIKCALYCNIASIVGAVFGFLALYYVGLVLIVIFQPWVHPTMNNYTVAM